jgi:hypothetical protein
MLRSVTPKGNIMLDKIDLNKVTDKDTPQKKAYIRLIKFYGNCNQLALAIDASRAATSRWLWRKIKSKDQDLMFSPYAQLLQKDSKIKGIAIKLCPSLKRLEK